MPVEELASGLLRIIGRFIAYMLIDLVLEILVKGLGYIIIRVLSFSKEKEINPDDFKVVLAGVVFWALIIALALWVIRSMGRV